MADTKMSLFKKILLSLFPKWFAAENMNPASMFISFISAKQFFSLVNRKIVENYKLNLFDIALDPFEVKIGFGENPAVKVKDIDFYYGYCSAANLNGYRLFNPTNMATSMAIVMSMYTKDIFDEHDDRHFLNFLFTIYLLTYVFYARVKVFPHETKEDNFNRFVEVFFSFYKVVCEKTKTSISKKDFEAIKKRTLREVNVMFCLFTYYKHCNDALATDYLPARDLHAWIFYDELRKGKFQKVVTEYANNIQDTMYQTWFSSIEKQIIDLLLPADLLIRYLFDDDALSVAHFVIPEIYPKEQLDEYMQSFVQTGEQTDEQFDDFLIMITDYSYLRDNFFSGIQKYIMSKIRAGGDYDHDIEEEINEFMSTIGDNDITSLKGMDVPEKIKQESQLMERLVNFYITYVWGLRISRGDTWYLRMTRKEILDDIVTGTNLIGNKQDSLYYYGWLLYSYSKNVFYYKYAFDNIRAGKEKFSLPFRASFREVYSNMFIIKMFDENFVATLLQDINPEDVKIYVKQKNIIDSFKKSFGKEVSEMVQHDDTKLIEHVYQPIQALLSQETSFLQPLQQSLKPIDVMTIKDHAYSLEFRLAQRLFHLLQKQRLQFANHYSDMSILGILATMRDTLLWFLLYCEYLSNKQLSGDNNSVDKSLSWSRTDEEKDKDYRLSVLMQIYIVDVVNVAEQYMPIVEKIIKWLYDEFHELLAQWINIDDNQRYCKIGHENWIGFVANKQDEEILAETMGEDIIWFRWYIKNLTYYNRRYLIPSGK